MSAPSSSGGMKKASTGGGGILRVVLRKVLFLKCYKVPNWLDFV